MRKIPTSMATQHPDNASKPYWHSRPFISTAAEIKECFLSFKDLGIDEYNWDWEGKFVDEAVIDRLLHQYYEYFANNPLGSDKFLTFRIPNPRIEKQFRLARAFMVVITSSQFAQSLGFNSPPIFETILPLTETAEEIIEIQKAYRDLVSIDHRLLQMDDSLKEIEIIPLFEQIDRIINSAEIVSRYIKLHKKEFGKIPKYLRPYCARSDPALNSGLIPTMLALKIALSQYQKVEKDTGVKLYPMVGTGSLPFRGGVTPSTIEQSLEEYAGISTFIIQSAFRYDYPLSTVKAAIKRIHEKIQHKKARQVSGVEINIVKKILPLFESPYRHTVEKLARLINTVSLEIPKRRERVQHVGLFGYSRGIGKVSLPRAISYTASLYSLGIPPEIIGAGRGLLKAQKMGWKQISHLYVHMKEDLIRSGNFLNKEQLVKISHDLNLGTEIIDDVKNLEKLLGIELGPTDPTHFEHQKLTAKVYERIKEHKKVTPLITYTGILRKSLG